MAGRSRNPFSSRTLSLVLLLMSSVDGRCWPWCPAIDLVLTKSTIHLSLSPFQLRQLSLAILEVHSLRHPLFTSCLLRWRPLPPAMSILLPPHRNRRSSRRSMEVRLTVATVMKLNLTKHLKVMFLYNCPRPRTIHLFQPSNWAVRKYNVQQWIIYFSFSCLYSYPSLKIYGTYFHRKYTIRGNGTGNY